MSRLSTRLDASLRLTVARNIRAAQEELGLKNEELAREVGFGLRLVQKHRAGENAPTLENLARYGRALRKPVAYFFEVGGEKAA